MPNIPPSKKPNWYSIELEIDKGGNDFVKVEYYFKVDSSLIIQEFYNKKEEQKEQNTFIIFVLFYTFYIKLYIYIL